MLFLFKKIIGHKIILTLIILAMGGGGYFLYHQFYQTTDGVVYQTSLVATSSIVSTLSGTGQVTSVRTFEITPKVSGDVSSVKVTNGQIVEEGDVIVQLEASDAARTVSEARFSLYNAELEMQELLAVADTTSLLQAENSLADAQASLVKLASSQAEEYQDALTEKSDSEQEILNGYEDAYNNIVSAFLTLPDAITTLNKALTGTDIADSEISVNSTDNASVYVNTIISSHSVQLAEMQNLIAQAKLAENSARNKYNETFLQYGKITRNSSQADINILLTNVIETTRLMADAFKAETTMVDYWIDYREDRSLTVYMAVTNYQTSLRSNTNQVNNHLTTLLATQKSIITNQNNLIKAEKDISDMDINHPLNIAASERSLKEKEQAITDLKAGPTELEIRNKELSVRQKQNTLTEALQNYEDFSVKAPFAGKVVDVNVLKGDSVSGSSILATLQTDQKIVELSLNEVDAAKIKLDQKAVISFDAIDSLSLTGKVIEVGSIGTVNSGVVSYSVKVYIDHVDEQVKQGMSASVSIIIEAKQNILTVPISAVKTTDGGSYVEVLVNEQIEKKVVTTGISDDTTIEIVSGLSVGDSIITQTMQTTSATESTEKLNNSSRQGPGAIGQIRMLN